MNADFLLEDLTLQLVDGDAIRQDLQETFTTVA